MPKFPSRCEIDDAMGVLDLVVLGFGCAQPQNREFAEKAYAIVERELARRGAATGEKPKGATATRREVGRWLRVSASTLKRWSDDPKSTFPTMRKGKRRYTVADIETWLSPSEATGVATDPLERFTADMGGADWLSRVPT